MRACMRVRVRLRVGQRGVERVERRTPYWSVWVRSETQRKEPDDTPGLKYCRNPINRHSWGTESGTSIAKGFHSLSPGYTLSISAFRAALSSCGHQRNEELLVRARKEVGTLRYPPCGLLGLKNTNIQ